MSDYDKLTDKEVASSLEILNGELSKKGLLHAADDCIMMQAIRRLRAYGETPNLKEHMLNDDEWIELHRWFEKLYFKSTPRDHDQQLKDYAEHPIQFSIYRKLGLLSQFYLCEYDKNRRHCSRVAEYVTNPFSETANKLFEKIGKEAGIDDTWCDEGERAISKYFEEHLMDIVQPEFRCEKHIGKLKEIAIKI